MRSVRALITTLMSCTLFVIASCTDSTPLAPRHDARDAVRTDILGSTLTSLSPVLCAQLPYDSVTATIDRDGGVIQVGPHTFTIPAGALARPVAITAIVRPEYDNRIIFKPDGLTFRKPALLSMSYANCAVINRSAPLLRVAYVDSSLNVLEVLSTTLDLASQRVTGQVNHFSDYMVAW
jgi:hypothetical protein